MNALKQILNRCAILFFTTCTLSVYATPGIPQIAWLELSYQAPAQYTLQWNMWWGNNGNEWRLVENGQTVHTAQLTPNGQNAQSGQFQISKSSGGNYTYQIKLCNTALSPEVCSESATKTITVAGDAINQPPVANAGSDSNTQVNQAIALSGSYSDDGLSSPISSTWSQQSGPANAQFSDTSSLTSSVSFTTNRHLCSQADN